MFGLHVVGAKPQEDFLLSKNERSAVGGRRSGGTGHFGRSALEGQLSARRSAVGTFSKLFLLMISLIKIFSGASRRI